MLGIIGNMAYDYIPAFLKMLVDQGAIEIVSGSLIHFYEQNDPVTCKCAIDALGSIAHNKQICGLISEHKIVSPILKLLKGMIYDESLVFKTTRCLYRICVDERIRK